MNVAVVVAGGSGARFGSEIPKQFLKVCGKKVIEFSVETFSSIEEISQVVVVCHKGYISLAKNLFKNNTKVVVIEGASTRAGSSKNAIDFLQNKGVKNILIHDAARPLVTKEIILECLEALKTFKAAVVAVPLRGTISKVQNGYVVEIPNREDFMEHQTPQCFDFETIRQAFNASPTENFTDDASAVYGLTEVKIIQGSQKNFKITHKEDITLLKHTLRSKVLSVVFQNGILKACIMKKKNCTFWG